LEEPGALAQDLLMDPKLFDFTVKRYCNSDHRTNEAAFFSTCVIDVRFTYFLRLDVGTQLFFGVDISALRVWKYCDRDVVFKRPRRTRIYVCGCAAAKNCRP
jgi:hypothetical protein